MDFLLHLFALVTAVSFSQGLYEDSCRVFSKAQYIEVGSSTEVLCQGWCVKGGTYWTVNSRAVMDGVSETITSTHTVLSLRNFSLPSATVQCHSSDTHQILGGVTIRTYSKPRGATCFLHYEEDKGFGLPHLITCSWEHQRDSALKVNYTVFCSSESSDGLLTEICNSQVTTCTVKVSHTGDHFGILMGEDFNITVRAKTAAWEAYSDYQELNSDRILKINPPKPEVTAFSDHLLVTWNRSRNTDGDHCQVKYRKVSSTDDTPQQLSNKTVSSVTNVKIRIKEGLESCSSYALSVRCALEDAPWSSWSTEWRNKTKLNRRDIKLRLWRKLIEVEDTKQRTVRVMWSGVPSECEGPFTYTVKLTKVNSDPMEALESNSTCGSSPCDVAVSRDAHRLTLSGFQQLAWLTDETVYVPAAEESLPQVTEIRATTHDGVIAVSWRASDRPVRSYMVDWTHDGNRYNWKESKDTSATLLGLEDMTPYDISVTPLFDNKTGHVTRALQVCSRVGEPGIVSINNIQPDVFSAVIIWDRKARSPCGGEVVNYTVFYKAQGGVPHKVTVSHMQKKVVLQNLDPDTQYNIHVEATALTGTNSSAGWLFKTKTFDPNLITKVIVCGCVVIFFLLLILGVAVLCRRIQKKAIPNPSLSSVALWTSMHHQNGMCLSQPFSDPTETALDTVYAEEHPKPSTAPLDWLSCGDDAASDRSKKNNESALKKYERSADSGGTLRLSPQEESVAFLSPQRSPVSPYRSQTSGGSVNSAPSERLKQQENTQLPAVYVTLDMFEHVQQR